MSGVEIFLIFGVFACSFVVVGTMFNDFPLFVGPVAWVGMILFLAGMLYNSQRVENQPPATVTVRSVTEEKTGLVAHSIEGNKYKISYGLALEFEKGATICKTKGGSSKLASCSKP